MAVKRLTSELKQLETNGLKDAYIQTLNDNVFEWRCVLIGPAESVYEGGYFGVTFAIHMSYPFVCEYPFRWVPC